MSSAHGPVSALTPTSQSSPPSRLAHGGFCPDCCPVHPHNLFCRADSGHRAHRGTLMCLSRALDSCLLLPRPEVHWDSLTPIFPGGKMLGVVCGGRRKPAARPQMQVLGGSCSFLIWIIAGTLLAAVLWLSDLRYGACSLPPHTHCTHPMPCFQPTCHPQRSQTQRSSKTGALWGP